VTWRLRRSPVLRQVLWSIARVCAVLVAVVVLITAGLVELSGHPVAWSVIGFLFAAAPLAGLLGAVAVTLRAAMAAGPGWIGVRFVRRWRVIDLGQVRTVRFVDGAGFGGFGSFVGGGGFGGFGGGRFTSPRVVLEDAGGATVEIGLDALNAPIGDMLRHGLGPDAQIDPDAARALAPPEDSDS
jgi:hypothetical protein